MTVPLTVIATGSATGTGGASASRLPVSRGASRPLSLSHSTSGPGNFKLPVTAQAQCPGRSPLALPACRSECASATSSGPGSQLVPVTPTLFRYSGDSESESGSAFHIHGD